MATRRKVSNLLAFAVLGTLTERPMHPYEIATVLKERNKDVQIHIRWGSLYTVVANLEKHGLIEATGTAREGQRPERTVYALTEAGWEEFRDWLRELLGAHRHEPRRLAAGLSFLPGLPPDEAAALLAERERALRAVIDERQRGLDEVHHQRLPRLFLIEEEYDLAILRAEADWIRAFRTEIETGALPGLAGWRWAHESGLPLAEAARRLAERGWEPG